MLPLSLLNAAQNKPMLVELKNGETFNGHLVNCDNFMNITLREVYQTSAEGDRFWKLKECYVRGSTIKYLRVPDQLLDSVKEEQSRAREANRGARGAPGGRGGRGMPNRGISHQSLSTLLMSNHSLQEDEEEEVDRWVGVSLEAEDEECNEGDQAFPTITIRFFFSNT
ncbi:Sm-like ribonucleo protein [Coprinopsis marcescibilis]|uniref:LSM complex subunit LSM4 n=1 Tax=Coprinopsis marcescibilis TaxID=230819 RepID=A0A5C3L176_COPMA|nr:Sm-like ribonucleo protein [Coprinopsis marcescibilis]